jgi:AcrR family transcriptional regulator
MSRSTAQAKPAAERKRQPTEVRRMLVVDAARDVIAERGLFATTMRDIARAAEVSVGTLTYHFTGIAEILNEVLDREMVLFYEPLLDKAREAERGLDALHILIDCFFADDERTVQHWRLWLDFWSVSAHDARYGDWQRATYLRWRADVLRMFTRAREQGDLVRDDLETVTFEFLALFDGSAVQAFLPRSPLGPDDARARLAEWLGVAAATPKEHP